MGEKSRKKRCEGMEGILTEGADMLREEKDTAALDAAIIAPAQKAEHCEITSYGTLIAWAKELGQDDCAVLLGRTLEEEKQADRTLRNSPNKRPIPRLLTEAIVFKGPAPLARQSRCCPDATPSPADASRASKIP